MNILSKKASFLKEYSIMELKIEPPIKNESSHVLFGVDPGTTKLGLAWIWKNIGHVYEVNITRNDNPVARILLNQEILSECFRMFDYAPLMVIEGSSFYGYRQTELAEVRASTVLWAFNKNITPSLVPPLTIRKKVFGSAKIKAEQQWSELPPDAASALACAYYSI